MKGRKDDTAHNYTVAFVIVVEYERMSLCPRNKICLKNFHFTNDQQSYHEHSLKSHCILFVLPSSSSYIFSYLTFLNADSDITHRHFVVIKYMHVYYIKGESREGKFAQSMMRKTEYLKSNKSG